MSAGMTKHQEGGQNAYPEIGEFRVPEANFLDVVVGQDGPYDNSIRILTLNMALVQDDSARWRAMVLSKQSIFEFAVLDRLRNDQEV
ncbi:hypothetical protein VTN49DRAFT_7402 [Thermomyces lanuginosus]|uniref:uncharacterized protein n=1 Tax=Thermomyces lanuginosus TaxID=5541 RepID=UPI0037442AD4